MLNLSLLERVLGHQVATVIMAIAGISGCMKCLLLKRQVMEVVLHMLSFRAPHIGHNLG